MDSCNEHSANTLRYLDNELSARELEAFFAHLRVCTDCKVRLEEEQDLSRLLHRNRPLYPASAALRARVSAAVRQHSVPGPATKDRLYDSVLGILRRLSQNTAQRVSNWKVLAPAALGIALCLLFLSDAVRKVQAASYVATAVAIHRDSLNTHLPTEIQTGTPEAVTAWFTGKVPFHLQLPNSRPDPNSEPVYQLTGARLVNYKGSPAASVTYKASGEMVSLLIASSKSAVVAGGDQVRSGSLTFHYSRNAGHRVVTWSNRGVSYALVSPLAISAQESCLVCHQDMADRKAFEPRR
jgi:anti-sigma factor RsiW